MSLENETWVIDEGDEIIRRKADAGGDSLNSRDLAIYYFWVADYSVRNAGDLETAYDCDAGFRRELERLAAMLPLPHLRAALTLSDQAFCATYEQWFDAVCEELKALKP